HPPMLRSELHLSQIRWRTTVPHQADGEPRAGLPPVKVDTSTRLTPTADMDTPTPAPTRGELRCSFCGLRKRSVVAGPGPEIAICSSCIRLCVEILEENATLDHDD